MYSTRKEKKKTRDLTVDDDIHFSPDITTILRTAFLVSVTVWISFLNNSIDVQIFFFFSWVQLLSEIPKVKCILNSRGRLQIMVGMLNIICVRVDTLFVS